ncbi:ARMT1-like domain-containing protein [Helicobacter sp. faydin-H76]|uniref:ARMT1-like domain-containing protein n=1 Tax=Helicobacter cappadocius TaxID=3063998 RepID=A0AA90T4M7_9HELI|nr:MULTISPECIES: ARMT1-like domain-containing protein [unclassified Helicobacter]MDO7252626.1 ARMT1-like domain-containing protein [Helicobacter sp. faydin-H75]MDP2538493.1 ARMT1-like domain-containing protein [Helicobacter sp. faydin-H76]
MKIEKKCLLCLANQCNQTMEITFQPKEIANRAKQAIESLIQSLPYENVPPPKIAIDIYKKIASITSTDDIYQHIKTECIQKARIIVDDILCKKPIFKTPEEELQWAIKISALGNIIDYGSATKFSIKNEVFNISKLDFAVFDLKDFYKKIQNSKTLLYLADNAGENIFDEVLISTIKSIYPHIKITYLTRGAPIINDITLNDMNTHLECKKIFDFCEVADSGVKSPGFIYEDANPAAQQSFNQADIILAKGMGNFECLENIPDSRIFLLFKIKCEVVSNHLKIALGKMMFKQNSEK